MPVRAALCGRNLDDLRELLAGLPVELVEQQPEIVISHGGDGALLGAERDFPGIPKYPVRDWRHNPACPIHPEADVLAKAFSGQLRRFEVLKIEARVGQAHVVALNDISIHRRIHASAVRFRLALDDELYANQIVGDGLVLATPFGSTGYYRSITHSLFRLGLGLAFNNTTEPIDHLVIEENCIVHVDILRGPAVLVADNDPHPIDLQTGDTVEFRQTDAKTVVYGLDIFRCRECLRLRHKRQHPN